MKNSKLPVGILAIALMIATDGQSLPHFDVASIKPYKSSNPGRGGDLQSPTFLPDGRFISRSPLIMVIGAAYGVPFFGPAARISGGPDWINSLDLVYDIQATPANKAALDALSTTALAAARRQMLQSLLADRFNLTVRHVPKEMPVYVLTVDKGGPKLPKADIQEKDCPDAPPATASSDGNKVCHRFAGGRGRGLHAMAANTSDLVTFVESWTDRPVLDETGLQGLYRIETEPWRPMEIGSTQTNVDGANAADLPTLFTIFERLGLKLTGQKRTLDTYVVDHIEKPTGN